MTRPVLITENSRTVLMTSDGPLPAKKLPQFVAAFTGTISAICLGMVFTWTSSALPVLKQEIGITDSQGSWIGSLVNLGAFLGAIPAGPIANILGRKVFLEIMTVPVLISWLLIANLYEHIPIVYFARFLAGISTGAISVASPMYVAEIAHISVRGTLGTFFQVQITIGILVEYVLGGIIYDVKTLSLASSVLSVVSLLCFAFVPESPVFLCSKGKMEEAKRSLSWFRGEEYDVEDELMKTADQLEESNKNKVKITDLFNDKAAFRALVISFGLMICQQLSGVNAVLFYANDIFAQGRSSLSPNGCSILVGLVQVLATLGSTVLIDKAGRKILLVVSTFVMCLSISTLGCYFFFSKYADLSAYSFIPLISVASFIIFFSIGIGPIPWMIMGELFEPQIKGVASSFSASLNWFLAFIVTKQFATLIEYCGIGITFIIFGVICGLGAAFITLMVPETKGKSIEQVKNNLLGVEESRGNAENEKVTFV